ncbi:MAG TPA: efflux RND transporter permease subunit [Solirubrobacteraceae bacterium]|nr:efflux RND transporter permease subunit [Solirubrobacteraceae bacterium]
MRRIIEASLRFRLVVLGIAAALIVAGVTQLRNAPVDVLPEFTPPYVEVQTEALGLSAEEVEQLVTVPLEADLLNGTAGLSVLRSESVPGMSSIVLLFEPGTDVMDARQLVQEQLTQAHANPNVSKPPQMIQPLSSESRVMMIGLSPSRLSPIDASVLARWTIRPRLMGVPGVANVAIFGQRDLQLQVLVDPEQLRDRNVTLSRIIHTAGNAQLVSPLSFLEASTPGTGGFIDTPNQRLQVRHILPTVSPRQLAGVPVEGSGGAMKLGDVSHVVEDHQPLIGDAVVGNGTGLLLVVEKLPGANTLQVTRDVDDALNELRPGLAGMQVDSHAFRPADFIQSAIDHLTVAIIAGCVLLALVLFAFMLDWRAALTCFAAFAVSLIAAALVLYATGSTFNALIFAGLAVAVGAVVDDAVIDVDNVRRRGRPALVEAVAEMRGPIGYATLVILLAAVPVLFIQGITGSFLQPLVRAYAVAIIASLVVALTLTPALSSLLLRGGRTRGGRPAARYGAALARVVAKPRWVLGAAALALLAGIALIPLLHGPVIPPFKDRDIVAHLDAPPGTSQPEMARILERATRELRATPGVSDVTAHLGRAITGDQTADVNSSEVWIRLDPDANYGATRAAVQRVVDGYPGFAHSISTYEQQRIRDVAAVDDRQAGDAAAGSAGLDALTGKERRPLVVRLYGEEPAVLNAQAARLQRMLRQVDGVVDPRVERTPQEPTVTIEADLARAERLGVKPGDVRRDAATLLSGIEVGSIFTQQKVFEVVVRATPDVRRSLTDIRRLLIDTPDGGHVRLGDVATVAVKPTPSVIQREASSRRIDITAGVSGRGLGAVQSDVKDRIRHATFPLEYHAQVIGNPTGSRATTTRFVGFGIAAAIGIFLLLQAAFGSWRLATLAFLTVPIGLLGGELAGLIDGSTFSLGALAGLLAVFAIAARNAIVLIRHYQGLERGGEALSADLVVRGARDRLAPIAITAAATAAVVLPFVVLGERAGYEIVHPLAIVVLGGLVTTTLVTLFVLPALYLRFGGRPLSPADELLLQWAEPAPEPEKEKA